TDLLDAKPLLGPRLFVIHLTLHGMILEQNARTDAQEFRRAVAQYVRQINAHVIAISRLKGASWGFPDHLCRSQPIPKTICPGKAILPGVCAYRTIFCAAPVRCTGISTSARLPACRLL